MKVAPPALSFSHILERNQIEFVEEGPWLHAGVPDFDNKWIVFVSAKSLECPLILDLLIPLLKTYQLPFRLVKDEICNYSMNAGFFGLSEVGKFICIFPRNESEASVLIKDLDDLTEAFSGPTVPDTLRVGHTVFAALGKVLKKEENGKVSFILTIPPEIPFTLDSKYNPAPKKDRLWGGYYIPTSLVRPAPKGDIYKATSLKDLSLNDVLLKEARAWALEDWENRDIKSRMRWQIQVINELQETIPTPRVMDCFEKGEDYVMVMDYVDGIILPQRLDDLRGKQRWSDIPGSARATILNYYLQIINIVRKVHDKGYVHRDLQDNNFIVSPSGQVFIVDFELSYMISKRIPAPAYPLGTFGYISPEQISDLTPCREADIYSLGALLYFMVTMTHPQTVLGNEDMGQALKILGNHIGSGTDLDYGSDSFSESSGRILEELIIRCLDPKPAKRPSLLELYHHIYEHASYLLMETTPTLEECMSSA